MYNKRAWLNPDESDSTSSVIAFNGMVTRYDESIEDLFLEISDCSRKIRLHQTQDDTKKDFITKMEILKDNIESFIDYLKHSKKYENNSNI